jgi:hypothetical protein
MGRVIAMRSTPRKKSARPANAASATIIAPPAFRISANAEFRRRFPRTQQEAGIAAFEWEDRARPLRGWGKDLLAGAFIFLFAVACIFIATAGQP